MLTLSNLSKSFGDRVLFEDASLQVNRGDRLGLVGANGAGKSTLFSLILGEDTPDEGAVSLERRATLGFLPQETAPVGDETVLEVATAISPEVVELKKRLHGFEAGHEADSADFHEVMARYEELGGYQLEPRAKTILRGLAFRERDFDRPARAMSGGWVMRAYIARLLVQQPDLLMLDEPTNHLDLEALRWLQEYLKSYPGAILLISHDREFLNQLVGSIVEIRQRRLLRYRGNYDDYLVQREAQAAQLLAAYENQQKKIEQLQTFADRFRAKASKAAQAQSKLKQIERMDKIEAPEAEGRGVSFRFPQPPRSGRRVMSLVDIHHAYGENTVYRGMNFELERGQRLVLVGPNGAGKSTLLKLLAGVLPVQQGQRELGLNVKVGYYAQYRVEMLNPAHTVLQAASDLPQPVPEQTIRTVLGSFLFTGDDVFKPVSVLSGGEKSRLALARLLLDPPNLLLMDEPTTHLDMNSIEALIGAMIPFEGTLVFISHDVYFIRKLGQQVLHVQDGHLHLYPGDYDYYLGKHAQEVTAAHEPAVSSGSSAPVESNKDRKRREAEERQARSREKKEREQAVKKLEVRIQELEKRQHELVTALEDQSTYDNPAQALTLNRELSHVVEDLEKANSEWETAATRVQELDGTESRP
jgi:ATP-binding cassette subfamily F protein 3